MRWACGAAVKPKLRFANTFSVWKYAVLKSYGPKSSASIDDRCKSGFSDPAGRFDTTRSPIDF
jgi:hypothetical protein